MEVSQTLLVGKSCSSHHQSTVTQLLGPGDGWQRSQAALDLAGSQEPIGIYGNLWQSRDIPMISYALWVPMDPAVSFEGK